MSTLEERFARLGIDTAPGQETQATADAERLAGLRRGEDLPGTPVDFSHGDVDAFPPIPSALGHFTDGVAEAEGLRERLVGRVTDALGKALRPKAVYFVDALPKTRNAKVMRRVIRAAHLGGDLGNVTALEDEAEKLSARKLREQRRKTLRADRAP